MKVNAPVVLISDFDGTISKDDFFWYLINKFLTKEDLQPWNDYLAGNITHVQALGQIFEKVHVENEKFDKFILTLPLEEAFVNTVKFCNEKGIPFHIVSAGADYYINYLMKYLKVEELVSVHSNKSFYSKETGLKYYELDKNDPFYSKEYGISKKKFVQSFKDKGYFCIYAGDGRPDFEAAKISDVVFARGVLLEKCNNEGIKSEKFCSYGDILDFINSLEIINE